MDRPCFALIRQQETGGPVEYIKFDSTGEVGASAIGMISVRIGFGGGCHWCTEAVFQSLCGVGNVQQGFIRSLAPHDAFSEAVIVTFDPNTIPTDVLVDVHLRTHASTSAHNLRGKYRSAVYVFSEDQHAEVNEALAKLQEGFGEKIITLSLPFGGFEPSPAAFQDYYRSDASKPFCRTYIDPKLAKIRQQFGTYCDY